MHPHCMYRYSIQQKSGEQSSLRAAAVRSIKDVNVMPVSEVVGWIGWVGLS